MHRFPLTLWKVAHKKRHVCQTAVTAHQSGLIRTNNNNDIIYLLQLGCNPVAVVILHVYKIWDWLLINLSLEGYMRSMLWQLRMLGTVWAFAYRHRETEKTCVEWPVAGPSEYWLLASSPASKVKKKQQCTHSTTNTHKMTTTIHTANQQQLHTRQLKTSNNTHETD